MTIIRVDRVENHGGISLPRWELLQTQTASGDATIDVIDVIGSHVMYKFFWYGFQPATDIQPFYLRTSTDNGGAWDAGVSDYAFSWHNVSMATSPVHSVAGDDADAQIQIMGNVGNAANELCDLEITLFNPSGTEYTKFKWEGFRMNLTTVGLHVVGAGVRLSAADVTGVRFLFDTGNIASGTLKVYGLNAG